MPPGTRTRNTAGASQTARRGTRRTLGPMDDERWESGMPVLDRQHAPTPLPPSLRGLPPRSVPEAAPTPLQKHFVLLSAPALVFGAVAITALNLGFGFESLLVKACVLLAAPLLL